MQVDIDFDLILNVGFDCTCDWDAVVKYLYKERMKMTNPGVRYFLSVVFL